MSRDPNSNAASDAASSPVPLGPRTLSPSKIETLQCPYRYRELYVRLVNDRPVENVALALGTLAHELAAFYADHCREHRMSVDTFMLDELKARVWAQRPFTVPESAWDDYELFARTLSRVVFEPETIAGIELRIAMRADFSECDWTDPDAAWGGMIDLAGIHGRGDSAVAYAWDWTTAAISGQFAAKKDLQLRMYGFLIYKRLGIAHTVITTRSLRTGATRTVELDQEDHDETYRRLEGERDRLAQLLAGDERFEWPAIPNSQCGICTLRCPAYHALQGAGVPLRIDSPGEAVSVLNQVVLMDAKRKALIKALKGYTTFHGAVAYGGMEAAIRPQVTLTVPPEPTFALLADRPMVDAWSVLKVDRKVLAKVLRKDQETLAAIEALGTSKTSDRFGVKALGIDDQGEED